jgi:uncharacterized protein YoxC
MKEAMENLLKALKELEGSAVEALEQHGRVIAELHDKSLKRTENNIKQAFAEFEEDVAKRLEELK